MPLPVLVMVTLPERVTLPEIEPERPLVPERVMEPVLRTDTVTVGDAPVEPVTVGEAATSARRMYAPEVAARQEVPKSLLR